MNIFGLRVFEVDLAEMADMLPPDLPEVAEYLEAGDLIRFHSQTKRSVETSPGCYVVKFYNSDYTGRVVSVDTAENVAVIRYYDRWALMWRRAEVSIEKLELILKANVAI